MLPHFESRFILDFEEVIENLAPNGTFKDGNVYLVCQVPYTLEETFYSPYNATDQISLASVVRRKKRQTRVLYGFSKNNLFTHCREERIIIVGKEGLDSIFEREGLRYCERQLLFQRRIYENLKKPKKNFVRRRR
jgi:hypothetical protein